MSDFAMCALTYPVVPNEPLTVKLSSRLVELKFRLDTVEFDATAKKVWAASGAITSVITVLEAGNVALPGQSAFIR